MPLNAQGDIAYRARDHAGRLWQADPPVCNLCKQVVTRANMGWMCLEGYADVQFKFIACRDCTELRLSGPPLRCFLQRHGL
jgi:hypothetical protein